MFALDNLTANGNQTTAAVLADGTTVVLKFIYRAAIQRWTIDVAYQSFVARGVGLATHPNLLRLWRNVIPFGLQVATADGTDPFLANDLDNGSGPPRVVVSILDSTAGNTDVADAEAQNFSAGAAPAF